MDAFLDLPRHIGILGPVMNYDHRDYFTSGQDVIDAFTAFAAGLALAVTSIQPAPGTWRIVNRHGDRPFAHLSLIGDIILYR